MPEEEQTVSFAELLKEQERRMGTLDASDNIESCVRKLLRKRKIELDQPWGLVNPKCLRVPWVYPLLLSTSPGDLIPLQLSFRATWPTAPYLVTECCSLVLVLGNMLALAKAAKVADFAVIEATLPLLTILDEKIKYLDVKNEGKRAGLDANAQRRAISELRRDDGMGDVQKAIDRQGKRQRQQWQSPRRQRRDRNNSDSE